jgi:hypothetical protein
VNSKAKALLKALLSSSENKDELPRFLPTKIAEEIQSLAASQQFNAHSLLSVHAWSHPIHFSWISHLIQDFPTSVQKLFIGSLSYTQAKGVQQMLALPDEQKEISPFLRPFLLHHLRQALQEPELISEELLPPSPLNVLLKLERKYLFHVADLLGIHDLAVELRQVVDRDLLRKIHNTLSEGQLHFLHYSSKQPIKWASPKLNLQKWDGSKKQLNHLLHHRGLIRIAKAIAQEDANFRWHLLHRMDTGRAKIIQKELYNKQDPVLIPYFKNQVLHLAKRYQP